MKELDDEKYDGLSWSDCSADQRKEIIAAADYCTPENLTQIVLEEQFSPKYPRSARTVPFGWSERLTAILMTFFDDHDCLTQTQQNINNLITDAAKEAPGISPENLSSHNLRATGLTFIADVSLDSKMFRDIGGWEDIQTAVKYLRQSGRINTIKMYKSMRRKEYAPPVFPEKPKEQYPVVLNPAPFQGEPVDPLGPDGETYDASVRKQRAEDDRQTPLMLRHPREINIPDLAGMPPKPKLQFDITEGDLPGHVDESSDLFDPTHTSVDTTMTTLAAYTNPHTFDRAGDATVEQWRADNIQRDASSYTDETRISSAIPGIGIALTYPANRGWTAQRVKKAWNDNIATNGPSRPLHEQVMGVSIALLFVGLLSVQMAQLGIAIDPLQREIMLTPQSAIVTLVGSAIGIVQVLWSDHQAKSGDS
jgi:hypothetical protein